MGKKKEWVRPPEPPRVKFGTCEDCGGLVWKMETMWQMIDRWVCWSCREDYEEGFADCAGLQLPKVLLEGF